jgi:c-di-AMP phosphodiesterase-like protein
MHLKLLHIFIILVAGLITCIVSLINDLDLMHTLTLLLQTFVIFYFVGFFVKVMFKKILKEKVVNEEIEEQINELEEEDQLISGLK